MLFNCRWCSAHSNTIVWAWYKSEIDNGSLLLMVCWSSLPQIPITQTCSSVAISAVPHHTVPSHPTDRDFARPFGWYSTYVESMVRYLRMSMAWKNGK